MIVTSSEFIKEDLRKFYVIVTPSDFMSENC